MAERGRGRGGGAGRVQAADLQLVQQTRRGGRVVAEGRHRHRRGRRRGAAQARARPAVGTGRAAHPAGHVRGGRQGFGHEARQVVERLGAVAAIGRVPCCFCCCRVGEGRPLVVGGEGGFRWRRRRRTGGECLVASLASRGSGPQRKAPGTQEPGEPALRHRARLLSEL